MSNVQWLQCAAFWQDPRIGKTRGTCSISGARKDCTQYAFDLFMIEVGDGSDSDDELSHQLAQFCCEKAGLA